MKILQVTSEAVPFVKTGGLADVCGALPLELERLGHEVRLVIPRYQRIGRSDLTPDAEPLGVPTGVGERWCLPLRTKLPQSDVLVTFLEHDALYDRPGLYGPSETEEYRDNCLRFTVLCRGALQLCHKDGWYPDVIHCHDWQGAQVPAFLRAFEADSPLSRTPSLLTIHNLAYQGRFSAHDMAVTGLGWDFFDWRTFEFHGDLNLLKGGITLATLINTVSPSYAREIQTKAYGEGLDATLRHRFDRLRGVLNGIDTSVWNPKTDALIPARYTSKDLSGKAVCKGELSTISHQLSAISSDRLVAGFVGRLVEQKGADLILDALPQLVELGVDVCVLGTGDHDLEARFRQAAALEPHLSVWIDFNEELAHLIQAGSDLLLMPSLYEPCGLNQLYALAYGTLPVVTDVGGLRDSIVDDGDGDGTGFKMRAPTVPALVESVGRAVALYRDQPQRFLDMIRRAMGRSFAWEVAATYYEEIYSEAIDRSGG